MLYVRRCSFGFGSDAPGRADGEAAAIGEHLQALIDELSAMEGGNRATEINPPRLGAG
jgi:hypothetical protein